MPWATSSPGSTGSPSACGSKQTDRCVEERPREGPLFFSPLLLRYSLRHCRQPRQGGAPAQAVALPHRQADRQRQALEAVLKDVELAASWSFMEPQHEPGGGGPVGVQPLEQKPPQLGRRDLHRAPPLPPGRRRWIDAGGGAAQQQPTRGPKLHLGLFGQPAGELLRLDEPPPGFLPRYSQPLPPAE